MNDGTARVAIFWDKSYLWGLIAYRTFSRLGVDFELLTSEDIRTGRLDDHDVIFVPGGWASDKIRVLGEAGATAIRNFVERGGSYLGFCGGAGLALSHESGLGLAPFGRIPSSARLPNFSGKIVLRRAATGHPVWREIPEGTSFYAWWPGQFSLTGTEDVLVLARYGAPQPGSFVTDLPVGPDYDWEAWEKSYGINLNPERIVGEPAVVELALGAGRIMLSYPHFETPGDEAGHAVLLNMIEYLAGKPAAPDDGGKLRHGGGLSEPSAFMDEAAGEHVRPASQGLDEAACSARELERHAADFIAFGKQNFLWYWRNNWLLQWRRGVKGIEYSTLYGMLAELERLTAKYNDADNDTSGKLGDLKKLVAPFLRNARGLIMRERYAMNIGPLNPLKSDDEEIQALREKLFSGSRRCGGMYEEILDRADEILLPLLVREIREKT